MATFPEPAVEPAVGQGHTASTPSNGARQKVLEMVGHAKRVLEIGGAAGDLGDLMVANGCKVDWVEPDFDAADQAGDGEPRPYDVVVLRDVLADTRSPAELLAMARALLKPDGYAVVSVPNVAHADVRLLLLDGRWEQSDRGLLGRAHLHFFTYELLQEMLRESGFLAAQVERVIYPVFTTELDVDRADVDDDILKSILADAEAETYQFVVRAVLDNGDTAVRDAVARVNRLEREVHAARRDATMRVAEAELYRQHAVDAAERLLIELESMRGAAAEADAIKRTLGYRTVQPVARAAHKLRRRLRGSG